MALILEQCVRGLDKRGDARFLGESEGILDEDRKIIARHTDLVVNLPGYDHSLTVFPMPYDRLGVMMTFEDKDRVGRNWPYSHVIIVSRDDYRSIHANPFVLSRCHVFTKSDDVKPKLAPLRVDIQSTKPQVVSWSGVAPTGAWPSLVSTALARGRTYVFLPERRDQLAEAVLLCLPLKERLEFSFTTALCAPSEKSREQLAPLARELKGLNPADYEVHWCLVHTASEPAGPWSKGWRPLEGEAVIDLRGGSPKAQGIKVHAYASLVANAIASKGAPLPVVSAADGPLERLPIERVAAVYPFLDDMQAQPGKITQERFLLAAQNVRSAIGDDLDALGGLLIDACKQQMLAVADVDRKSAAKLAEEMTTCAASGGEQAAERAARAAGEVAADYAARNSPLLADLAAATLKPVRNKTGRPFCLFAELARLQEGTDSAARGLPVLDALLKAASEAGTPLAKCPDGLISYVRVAVAAKGDPRVVAEHGAKAIASAGRAERSQLVHCFAEALAHDFGAAAPPDVIADAISRLLGSPADEEVLNGVLVKLREGKVPFNWALRVHHELRRILLTRQQGRAADKVLLNALDACLQQQQAKEMCALLRDDATAADGKPLESAANHLATSGPRARAFALALYSQGDQASLLAFLKALPAAGADASVILDILTNTVCHRGASISCESRLRTGFRNVATLALYRAPRAPNAKAIRSAFNMTQPERLLTMPRVVALLLVVGVAGYAVWFFGLARTRPTQTTEGRNKNVSQGAAGGQEWASKWSIDEFDVVSTPWYADWYNQTPNETSGEFELAIEITDPGGLTPKSEKLPLDDSVSEQARQYLREHLPKHKVSNVVLLLQKPTEGQVEGAKSLPDSWLAIPVLVPGHEIGDPVDVQLHAAPDLKLELKQYLVKPSDGVDVSDGPVFEIDLVPHGTPAEPLDRYTYHGEEAESERWAAFWSKISTKLEAHPRVLCRFTTRLSGRYARFEKTLNVASRPTPPGKPEDSSAAEAKKPGADEQREAPSKPEAQPGPPDSEAPPNKTPPSKAHIERGSPDPQGQHTGTEDTKATEEPAVEH